MVWSRGFSVVVLVGVVVATACSGTSTTRGGDASGGTGAAGGGGSGAMGGSAGREAGGASGVVGRELPGVGGRAGAASGGRAGRGGSGGVAGRDAGECPATTNEFCDSITFGACPELVGGRWRAPCPEDAIFFTYETCDDGSSWFEWNVAYENDITLGFDANGTLQFGDSAEYDEPTCKVGDSSKAQGDCRICTICSYDEDGMGGEGGSGPEPCIVTSDDFVSQP